MKDLGDANTFLGIEIIRDRPNRSITLTQRGYVSKILTRFGKKITNNHKPLLPITTRLEPNPDQASAESTSEYQQQIGSIMYAMTKTRPDLAYPISLLARFMSNPAPQHFLALDKLWKYLGNTVNLGLVYKSGSEMSIHGYVDADWGGSSNRRSTTGYLFNIGSTTLYSTASTSTALSWNSKLQKTTALSSCEAEYMALKEAFKELIYIQQVCRELAPLGNITAESIYTDSQSAISLANNPDYHHKTKHIDIQYHFIREKVLDDIIKLKYLQTDKQLADALTKPVSQSKSLELVNKTGLRPVNN